MRISDWSSDVCSSDLSIQEVRMKLLFLAAAAAIAIPAAAQTTPDPATQDQATMPTDDSAMDQTTPPEQTAPTTPPMDQTAPTTPEQTTTTHAPAKPTAAAPSAADRKSTRLNSSP